MKRFRILFKIIFIFLLTLSPNFIFITKAFANTKNESEVYYSDYTTIKSLADSSLEKLDIQNAIIYYKKAIDLNKNEADLNTLGEIYFIVGEYNKALKCFGESNELNPQNKKTQIKISVVKKQIEKLKENEKSNTIEPKERAPKKIHELIKIDGKLKNKNSEEKLHKIIDFIWSDPQGRILLNKICNVQANIYLKKNIKNSYFTCYQTLPMNDAYKYDPIMQKTLAYTINIEKIVYIKESDVSRFQEKNTTLLENASSIMVVAHELCHFIKFMDYPQSKGTKQEELICYVVGYDIAFRALTDSSLSDDQVKEYTTRIYNGMKHNNYKYLAKEDDVARKMFSVGINVPKHSLYYDISKLDYKLTKNNIYIQQYVNDLNKELSRNYEPIFRSKPNNYIGYLYIKKSGEITLTPITKSENYHIKDDLFNIKIAQNCIKFPEESNTAIIPLILIKKNNNVYIKVRY